MKQLYFRIFCFNLCIFVSLYNLQLQAAHLMYIMPIDDKWIVKEGKKSQKFSQLDKIRYQYEGNCLHIHFNAVQQLSKFFKQELSPQDSGDNDKESFIARHQRWMSKIVRSQGLEPVDVYMKVEQSTKDKVLSFFFASETIANKIYQQCKKIENN